MAAPWSHSLAHMKEEIIKMVSARRSNLSSSESVAIRLHLPSMTLSVPMSVANDSVTLSASYVY